MQQGDFSQCAEHYHHRVGYSRHLLECLIKISGKTAKELRVADVGAGTGKLTEDLVALGLRVDAVEPNDAMRAEGKKATEKLQVEWMKGSGEETGLASGTYDWVLMGSSFHWVNLEKGLTEFHRILKPGGMFTAIWNPRDLESAPLQAHIDLRIKQMLPEMKRVSSGGKGYADDWSKKIPSTGQFKNVLFMESKDIVEMSRERYMGLWNSVNDIQAQAGPERWQQILEAIETEITGLKKIPAAYATRAWTAWRI